MINNEIINKKYFPYYIIIIIIIIVIIVSNMNLFTNIQSEEMFSNEYSNNIVSVIPYELQEKLLLSIDFSVSVSQPLISTDKYKLPVQTNNIISISPNTKYQYINCNYINGYKVPIYDLNKSLISNHQPITISNNISIYIVCSFNIFQSIDSNPYSLIYFSNNYPDIHIPSDSDKVNNNFNYTFLEIGSNYLVINNKRIITFEKLQVNELNKTIISFTLDSNGNYALYNMFDKITSGQDSNIKPLYYNNAARTENCGIDRTIISTNLIDNINICGPGSMSYIYNTVMPLSSIGAIKLLDNCSYNKIYINENTPVLPHLSTPMSIFPGQLSEVIVINQSVNNNQHTIIMSKLATKWQLLSPSIIASLNSTISPTIIPIELSNNLLLALDGSDSVSRLWKSNTNKILFADSHLNYLNSLDNIKEFKDINCTAIDGYEVYIPIINDSNININSDPNRKPTLMNSEISIYIVCNFINSSSNNLSSNNSYSLINFLNKNETFMNKSLPSSNFRYTFLDIGSNYITINNNQIVKSTNFDMLRKNSLTSTIISFVIDSSGNFSLNNMLDPIVSGINKNGISPLNARINYSNASINIMNNANVIDKINIGRPTAYPSRSATTNNIYTTLSSDGLVIPRQKDINTIFNGSISEVIVFNKAVTAKQHNKILINLANKWKLQLLDINFSLNNIKLPTFTLPIPFLALSGDPKYANTIQTNPWWRWIDYNTGNYNAVPINLNYPPIYKNNSIYFNNKLQGLKISYININNYNLSFFIVCNLNIISKSACLFCLGNNNIYIGYNYISINNYTFKLPSNLFKLNTLTILTCIIKNDKVYLYTMNELVLSGKLTKYTHNIDYTDIYIGAKPNGTNIFTGSVSEILIYNKVLSETDRISVFNNLNYKWTTNGTNYNTTNQNTTNQNTTNQNTTDQNTTD